MTKKQSLAALLVASIWLLFQFKFWPQISQRGFWRWRTSVLTPIVQEERAKFELVYLLKEAGVEIVSGPLTRPEIKGLECQLKLADQVVKVIFSWQRDFQGQLASLQLILKKSKIVRDRPIKLIDLTGSKPYVSF